MMVKKVLHVDWRRTGERVIPHKTGTAMKPTTEWGAEKWSKNKQFPIGKWLLNRYKIKLPNITGAVIRTNLWRDCQRCPTQTAFSSNVWLLSRNEWMNEWNSLFYIG